MAEGTPAELKKSVGTDVVVARVEGDLDVAKQALQGVYGVVAVEGRDHELTISVDEGSSAIGPIAIAFHDASIQGTRPHAPHAHARRRVPRARPAPTSMPRRTRS